MDLRYGGNGPDQQVRDHMNLSNVDHLGSSQLPGMGDQVSPPKAVKQHNNASSCSEFPKDDGRGGGSRLHEPGHKMKVDRRYTSMSRDGLVAFTRK